MSNRFFTNTIDLVAGAKARASEVESNFSAVEVGFDAAQVDIDAKAPIASPALSGMPTAPTPTLGASTNQIATTAFVQGAIVAGGSVPSPAGQDGKALVASGGTAGWQFVFPTQTGQTGKVLTTDGNVPSWIPLEAVGDHQIIVHSGNGHGSTNTCIRRYTTTKANVGSAIVYADSATLGASFTIQAGFGGLYAIGMIDVSVSGQTLIGTSKNSTTLSTSIATIASSQRVAFSASGFSASNFPTTVFAVVRLAAGDVVRPHTNSATNSTLERESQFSIIRVGL